MFKDYQDKMNKLANAQEAISYHLREMVTHLDDLSDDCRDIADNLNKACDSYKSIKETLLPSASVN